MALTQAERSKRWRLKNPDRAKEFWQMQNKRRRSSGLIREYRLNSEVAKQQAKKDNRKYNLKSKYKMTVLDFEIMAKEHNSQCAICEIFCDYETNPTCYHVDHCHSSNKVRGLLCGNCNRGLGMFKDNPKFLRKAADYTESFI